MGRKPCCDKEKIKRRHWTKEEDFRLKAFIEHHGTHGEWMSLPKRAGLQRCGKSCRMRWLNYLRPGIRHGDFSEYEDNLICSLYAVLGSRWSVIASHLPGRTDNDLKNYWNTRLKFRWIQSKKPRVASAKKTYTLPKGNASCEYFSVISESSYYGSSSSSTGTSHIPSDMDIFTDINWSPDFWPNEDVFETPALLRTLCNMNMNGSPAQEDPITDNNLMAESLLYCNTSRFPFDFTYGSTPSNGELTVSVDAFFCDDQSLIEVNEPLTIQQQKGESTESSRASTEDNGVGHRAENALPGAI